MYFQSGCIKYEPRSPPSESVILPASYGSSSSRRSTRDSEPSLLASCFSLLNSVAFLTYFAYGGEFSFASHVDLQRKIRYNKIEVITMEKTMTLNLRVNPTVKQQAEDVLKQLGIPMATAIDMYLRQITLTGGIPFSLSLPKAPAALNADTMTDDQLHAALQVGIKEIQNGDTVDAASAFAQFREQHR